MEKKTSLLDNITETSVKHHHIANAICIKTAMLIT